MRIRVQCKSRRVSPLFRNVVHAASRWAATELGLNDLPGQVTIKICPLDNYGDALWLSEGRYRVRLSPDQSVKDVLGTLFHELTHVHQYATDRLDLGFKVAIWEGTSMKIPAAHNKRPWEKEAFSSEKKLLKKYSKGSIFA